MFLHSFRYLIILKKLYNLVAFFEILNVLFCNLFVLQYLCKRKAVPRLCRLYPKGAGGKSGQHRALLFRK